MQLKFPYIVALAVCLGGCSVNCAATRNKCHEDELRICADNAEPLTKEKDLIVPDTLKSVSTVCKIWTQMTSCINNYTTNCMTQRQKLEFDKSFHGPVLSMHTLCNDKSYREEYLRHAPCAKRITTESQYCGDHYNLLIELIAGSTSTFKQICCARSKFRDCIVKSTPESCHSNNNQSSNTGLKGPTELPTSTSLALATLDSSFAFVSQRCAVTRFTDEDCPTLDPESRVRENSRGPLEIDLNSNKPFGIGGSKPPVNKKPNTSGNDNGKNPNEPPVTNKLSSKGVNRNGATQLHSQNIWLAWLPVTFTWGYMRSKLG